MHGASNPASSPLLPHRFRQWRKVYAVKISGAPLLSTTATTNSSVAGSPYPITAVQGSLSAANYTFSFSNANSDHHQPRVVDCERRINKTRPYGTTNSES